MCVADLDLNLWYLVIFNLIEMLRKKLNQKFIYNN